MIHEAYISLGSNMGDRELNVLRGLAEIGKLSDTKITAVSSFYNTEPVGPEPQDDFLNAVIRLATGLSAETLLKELMRIESDIFKRNRTQRWGPRTMDLDILLFGDLILQAEELTIPHPRMHERRFTLVPLNEIAPNATHPLLGKTACELLRNAPKTGRVIKLEEIN